MAKKFSDLEANMPPERRRRVQARIDKMLEEMPLSELRQARTLTQMHLAKVMRVQQSAVSKLERRTDMYVSTLRDFVRAMGGYLEIRAVFPDGAVKISQFRDLAPARKKR